MNIQKFDLIPGENVVATEFHYEPDNANDTIAQNFLTQFIQTENSLDLTIDGDSQSSPFDSLKPALDGVTLSTSLTGLNHPSIITSAHVVITLESLDTNLVSVEFSVHNPLDTDMVIEFVQSDSGLDGITYAFFRQTFESFVIPAGQTVGSGLFPNVLLTQGALASLDIIPRQMLDINAANTVRIGGPSGYQIPWLKLEQKSVPTTYDLVLTLDGAKMTLAGFLEKAKEILGPHPNSTAVSSISTTKTVSVNSSATPSGGASISGDGKPATAKGSAPAAEETVSDDGGNADPLSSTRTEVPKVTPQAVAATSPSQAGTRLTTETASPTTSSGEVFSKNSTS